MHWKCESALRILYSLVIDKNLEVVTLIYCRAFLFHRSRIIPFKKSRINMPKDGEGNISEIRFLDHYEDEICSLNEGENNFTKLQFQEICATLEELTVTVDK